MNDNFDDFCEIIQMLYDNKQIFHFVIQVDSYRYFFYLNEEVRLELDFMGNKPIRWLNIGNECFEFKSFDLLLQHLNADDVFNLYFNIDILNKFLKF